jgi:hypothetical protein
MAPYSNVLLLKFDTIIRVVKKKDGNWGILCVKCYTINPNPIKTLFFGDQLVSQVNIEISHFNTTPKEKEITFYSDSKLKAQGKLSAWFENPLQKRKEEVPKSLTVEVKLYFMTNNTLGTRKGHSIKIQLEKNGRLLLNWKSSRRRCWGKSLPWKMRRNIPNICSESIAKKVFPC